MYSSQTFGRIFWVDDKYEFKSCPLCTDGTGDFELEDYVSEWQDWGGVDYDKLFNIHKFCILNKINYAGSLTHKETPVTHKEVKSEMNVYNQDLYEQIVLDYEYRFPKFSDTNYPLHLTQH